MQMQDLLPALLRLIDPDELATYEGTTPTGNDYYANYRDGVDMLEYVIAKTTAGGGAARPCIYDVGPNVDAIEGITDFNGTTTQKFVSYPSNILAFDQERPGASYKHKARGSFIIKRISTSADNSTPSTIADTTIPDVSSTVVYVDIEVCEPILMSPFIFGSPENKQGFYGITNMNFQMNMAPNANRCWRSVKFKKTITTQGPPVVSTDYYLDKTASVYKFHESKLTFTFISGHPSDALPSRNLVPYYELPIYRTTGKNTLPARKLYTNLGGRFDDVQTYDEICNNIQLNMIPDKLIIYCKRRDMTTSYADAFLTITGININFNNNAGLLSSMTQHQLYKASVNSGLHMSWQEFSGLTMSVSNDLYGDNNLTEGRVGPLSGVGAFKPFNVESINVHRTIGAQLVPTIGSVLTLNFAEVIQLTEDYLAPGSIGSFNLQISLKVQNHQTEAWEATKWETFVIPMNSGIFVNERGTSSVYTALLTKADVLDASDQEHYSHGTIKRMVGGSMLNNLKSAMGWISSKLPFVRNVLGKIDHPYAKVGHDVLKAVGYGKSGGGASGGNNKLENRLM